VRGSSTTAAGLPPKAWAVKASICKNNRAGQGRAGEAVLKKGLHLVPYTSVLSSQENGGGRWRQGGGGGSGASCGTAGTSLPGN
jgi:hypothetical protein